MKKLVFVLLAVFVLTACEKNDDNLELSNEGISEVEFQGRFGQTPGQGSGIVDRVTIEYKPHVTEVEKQAYRNLHGPTVLMNSWYPCPNNLNAEVWVLDSGTPQEILTRTVPIHNDAALEDPEEEALNIRLNPMTARDNCNSL